VRITYDASAKVRAIDQSAAAHCKGPAHPVTAESLLEIKRIDNDLIALMRAAPVNHGENLSLALLRVSHSSRQSGPLHIALPCCCVVVRLLESSAGSRVAKLREPPS
jgi:hypothetical protein